MFCWPHTVPLTPLHSTIKLSQRYLAGLCSVWLGLTELLQLLQLLGIKLCHTTAHHKQLQLGDALQHDVAKLLRSQTIELHVCQTYGLYARALSDSALEFRGLRLDTRMLATCAAWTRLPCLCV